MTGRAHVIRAGAEHLPLPDGSVDLVACSPPYYGLRAYTDNGEVYDGQIGSEPTPAEYVDTLIRCTAEWMRVLKPTGSMFVNLGDSYYSGKGAPGRTTVDAKNAGRTARREGTSPLDRSDLGFPRKSLMMLPERYRIAAVDQLGLINRAVIVWNKPNGLPESVGDRVRRSHEDWVHLTKQPRYFSAVDEIREEYAPGSLAKYAAGGLVSSVGAATHPSKANGGRQRRDGNEDAWRGNPLGKLPGSVWTIPTQPLRVPEHLGVDHFAAFPFEFPRRIIKGWSPAGVCTGCGQGRRPISEAEPFTAKAFTARQQNDDGRSWHGGDPATRALGIAAHERDRRITGYACGCPDTTAPTTPAVILDPFGGTGTTALVAKALGRIGISVDLSADYCRLAQWRTNDPGELAAAMQVKKPDPAPQTETLDLFGESA